ncbi:hypothetical protein T492DRAFT_248389 [Pavlovales sp. CCMP2436]|nr:hypothetical protein T492DRAFT_248389 [Pavlovales sp. CCMP2436]
MSAVDWKTYVALSDVGATVTSLAATEQWLVIGTSTGGLRCYTLGFAPTSSSADAMPDASARFALLTQRQLKRRGPVEQLAAVPREGLLLVRSGGALTVHSLPSLDPVAVIAAAGARAFDVDACDDTVRVVVAFAEEVRTYALTQPVSQLSAWPLDPGVRALALSWSDGLVCVATTAGEYELRAASGGGKLIDLPGIGGGSAGSGVYSSPAAAKVSCDLEPRTPSDFGRDDLQTSVEPGTTEPGTTEPGTTGLTSQLEGAVGAAAAGAGPSPSATLGSAEAVRTPQHGGASLSVDPPPAAVTRVVRPLGACRVRTQPGHFVLAAALGNGRTALMLAGGAAGHLRLTELCQLDSPPLALACSLTHAVGFTELCVAPCWSQVSVATEIKNRTSQKPHKKRSETPSP